MPLFEVYFGLHTMPIHRAVFKFGLSRRNSGSRIKNFSRLRTDAERFFLAESRRDTQNEQERVETPRPDALERPSHSRNER